MGLWSVVPLKHRAVWKGGQREAQKAEAPRRRVLRPGLSAIFQSAVLPLKMVAVSGAALDGLCL